MKSGSTESLYFLAEWRNGKLIFGWNNHHVRALLCVALGLIILLAGILVWGKFLPPETVTFETREQAATPAGAEKAANAARVSISPSQAAEIANVIKESADREPDAVVRTTGESLEATIKTELQKTGGQFAIVTDSKEPASVPVPLPDNSKVAIILASAGALPSGTPVTLNQYNIKAYPDRLIQIGGSYREVLTAYSWKVDVPKIPLIIPRGAVGYLGVYGHANFDRPDMSRVGILLTIPK
jgi:hypothetical protein